MLSGKLNDPTVITALPLPGPLAVGARLSAVVHAAHATISRRQAARAMARNSGILLTPEETLLTAVFAFFPDSGTGLGARLPGWRARGRPTCGRLAAVAQCPAGGPVSLTWQGSRVPQQRVPAPRRLRYRAAGGRRHKPGSGPRQGSRSRREPGRPVRGEEGQRRPARRQRRRGPTGTQARRPRGHGSAYPPAGRRAWAGTPSA